MDHVSRPLIALLAGTVAFFAIWLVALKPSGGGAGSQKPGVYVSPIAKAHRAVAASAAASVAHGGTVIPSARPGARATTTTPAAATSAASVHAPTPTTKHPASRIFKTGSTWPAHRPRASAADRRARSVARAIQANKTLALLFYNAAGADDRAVRQELDAVPAHRGRVLRLAVPLSELARYAVVTNQVRVTGSPTLVVIDRAHHAGTIVGFADRFEISQLVADALAAS